MALFKATAVVNGTETEVELDDARYLPIEQHHVRLKETVRERLNRQAVSLRGTLLKDEEFVNEVLSSKGIDPKTLKPSDPAGKVLTEADVSRLQTEWEAKHLKPVQEQLQAANERFEKARAQTLVADLTRWFVDVGVDKSIAPRFAQLYAPQFGFDDKSGQHALRNASGDGFAFSASATESSPYKGVEEFVKEWAADPVNGPFVRPVAQPGVQLGDAPRPGSAPAGKRSEMTAEQKAVYIDRYGLEAFMMLPA